VSGILKILCKDTGFHKIKYDKNQEKPVRNFCLPAGDFFIWQE
jgi:hypothetical protein